MTEGIEKLAHNEGAALLGVAELRAVNTADFLLDSEVLAQFRCAISIAAPVSATVLDTIKDFPNQLYFHHYRQLNGLLDRIALRIAAEIEAAGHRALAIAASQIVDWKNQRAHLSHKRIGVAAGLGWIGRNNLLVTPEYGSRVRLVTILTDLSPEDANPNHTPDSGHALSSGDTIPNHTTDSGHVPANAPGLFFCGDCRACIAVCPAQAIKESAKDFDHQACFVQLKEFQRQGHVGQYICGICVRACGPRRLALDH
jgi:epoxyqueuosine reductase QueG